MSRRSRISLAALLACALTAAPAGAATTVTGTLRGGSFRVLAIACSGATTATSGPARRFALRLPSPAAGTSLQLLDTRGRYAGPVVLRRSGRRAALAFGAVRPGRFALGTLRAGKGFATVSGRLPKALRLAAATVPVGRTGAPTGAASLGLARARPGAATACGRAGRQAGATSLPGADPDADGVPSALDVDDNGNGVLDTVDATATPAAGSSFHWFSDMFVDASQTLNAHVLPAPGAYDQQVKDFLKRNLGMPLGWSGAQGDATEIVVDCGAVVLCSTGTLRFPPQLDGQGWTSATASATSAGRPTIPYTDRSAGGRGWEVTIKPTLDDTIGQLQVGQTLLVSVRGAAGTTTTALPVPAFFLTQPAVTAIAVGDGPAQDIAYPVGAGGSETNRMAVASTAMRLTWLRPQRPPITDAERAAFAGRLTNLPDYLGLRYYATVGVGQRPSFQYHCDRFDVTDTATSGESGAPMSASFDFGQCTAPAFAPQPGQTVAEGLAALPAGQRTFRVDFNAADLAQDNGVQSWYFTYTG